MNRIDPFKQKHHILFGLIRKIDVAINRMLNGRRAAGYTLSAWYGRHRPECLLCKWFHTYMEHWHCEKSARSEGLITHEEAEKRMKGTKT